ncbi:hypothetical protein BDDG_05580 [Blastomyces dermatitidis ATCC 18188]|uniref:Aminoglycoside phosphotransferase domain-containing protein n=1 Tax=Ajellomyces dermatitidis (strain ATCC 18188 / CBS 674.68) TaxID=653446 RepID=F2THC3_AJEDA|nr:hypothetical protein BDDG_05580 [Blastomyces dermatitidis ATCC 18188]
MPCDRHEELVCGSFNVCILVTIDTWKDRQQQGQRVLLRFPLPYRVGEDFRPGNGDEKIRCEAGAYAWLEETDQMCQFHDLPSRYYRHSNRTQTSQDGVMGAGYLLIECIDQDGETMLSNTWLEKQNDIKLRTNLFRDLSRIFNRPLSIEIQQLENEKIPTHIPRDYTYSTVESYVMDMLAIHDSQLQNQPNAVNNLEDCASQMSALAAMRTIFPLFFQQKFRRGPFTFTLTDLHQSNIFVDDNWHISRLVDLEWACSRPIEMVEMPYWLTNKGVDEIDAEEYNTIRMELMAALETEETKRSSSAGLADIGRSIPGLPATMEQVWASGTFSRSPVPQASSEYSTTISSPCYPIIFLRKSGRSCPFYG